MSGAEVVILIQNRLMKRVKDLGALSAVTAVPAERIKGSGSRMFKRMMARGVFVATPDGKLYLDEAAAAGFRRLRRRRILLVFLAGLALVLLVLIFGR